MGVWCSCHLFRGGPGEVLLFWEQINAKRFLGEWDRGISTIIKRPLTLYMHREC